MENHLEVIQAALSRVSCRQEQASLEQSGRVPCKTWLLRTSKRSQWSYTSHSRNSESPLLRAHSSSRRTRPLHTLGLSSLMIWRMRARSDWKRMVAHSLLLISQSTAAPIRQLPLTNRWTPTWAPWALALPTLSKGSSKTTVQCQRQLTLLKQLSAISTYLQNACRHSYSSTDTSLPKSFEREEIFLPGRSSHRWSPVS